MAQLHYDGFDVDGGSGIATGWSVALSGATATYAIDTSKQRTGIGCQRFIVTLTNPSGGLTTSKTYSLGGINLAATTVTATIYGRQEVGAVQSYVQLRLKELNSGSAVTNTITGGNTKLTVDGTYSAVTVFGVIVASTTVSLRLDIVCTGDDPGMAPEFYLDDYTLSCSVRLTGYTEDDYLNNLKTELQAMMASRQTAATVPNIQRVECDIPAVSSGQFPALFLNWISTTNGEATAYAYPIQQMERVITARVILVNGLFDKKYNEVETRKLLHAIRAWLESHRTINGYCVDSWVDRVDSGEQAFQRTAGQIQSHGVIEVTGKYIETVTHV